MQVPIALSLVLLAPPGLSQAESESVAPGEAFRQLDTVAAVTAEPGFSLVLSAERSRVILVRDRGVTAPNVSAVVGQDSEVILDSGAADKLPLAPDELAGLAADNSRRLDEVKAIYATTPRFGGAKVRADCWYLTITDVAAVSDNEWEVRVFPFARLHFGDGERTRQVGEYRVPEPEDGSGREIWRYRAGEGPGTGWRLIRAAPKGVLIGY